MRHADVMTGDELVSGEEMEMEMADRGWCEQRSVYRNTREANGDESEMRWRHGGDSVSLDRGCVLVYDDGIVMSSDMVAVHVALGGSYPILGALQDGCDMIWTLYR